MTDILLFLLQTYIHYTFGLRSYMWILAIPKCQWEEDSRKE